MRIVGLRKRVEEKFHLLFLVLLVDIAGESLVTFRNQFRARLNGMFAQFFLEQLARDAAVPDGIRFRVIFRPGRFLPAHLDRLVVLEIDLLSDQLLDLRHAIVHPLRIEVVDFVGRFQIPEEHIVVERSGVLRRQHVDILLGEEEMAEIEQLEIGAEKFLGNFVVERLMRVMTFFEESSHRYGHLFRI